MSAAWHPYPSPNLTLTHGATYAIRDSLGEERQVEYTANLYGFDGPAFLIGDGTWIQADAVFCRVEESK